MFNYSESKDSSMPKGVKEEKIGLKQKSAVGMNLVLNHPLKQSIYNLLFSQEIKHSLG